MKRLLHILVLLIGTLQAGAVVSPSQVAYDHFFDAATFALEAEASGDTVTYHLVMTYDEGRIRVPAGSALKVYLRDRTTITLYTDREVGRGDVLLRRWRDHTIYYVTCRYAITQSQLARMLDKDIYRLEIETSSGNIVRAVRRIKSKLSSAFAAVSVAK